MTRKQAATSALTGAKRVRLRDLAEELELSPATVSRALAGSPQADALAAETRKRVEQAARRLGYRPNYMARSLRGKRTFSVGVLVPEISEGYTAGLMSGVETTLDSAGYSYLMLSHRSRPEKLISSMDSLEDRGVEGLIVIGAGLARPPSLPAVVVSGNQAVEGATTVTLDHEAAAELAVAHLAELGHRRIALLRGAPGNVDAAERWRAIRDAAIRHGIEIPDALTLTLRSPAYGESFDVEGGYREGFNFGRELLATGEAFSALFAFNDISAIGAIRAFLDADLRIPEDLSVVGFDNLGVTPFLNPRLTTVEQPLRAMGETAAKILLGHLDADEELGRKIQIEPKLVVRDSTGPARVWAGRLSRSRSGPHPG